MNRNLTDDQGGFCIFARPGNWSIYIRPDTDDQNKANYEMYFPPLNITVADEPMLDLKIVQPNVTLEGYVNCLNMTQC